MKESEIKRLQNMADAIQSRQERCPWNPFPADSALGRRLDDEWRREQVRDKAAGVKNERAT